MNWKRKQKWLISPVVAIAMLFSVAGTAAATEPAEPDIQPAMTADTESDTKGETDEITEEETEKVSKEENNETSEEETEKEKSEEEIKEETDEDEEDDDSETGEETTPGTEETPEADGEASADAEDLVEEEIKEDDLPEDLDNLLPADLETLDIQPLTAFLSEPHEHSWSADWIYDETHHWHVCDTEDCPLIDNHEKDGYAPHSYGEDYVCIECGCPEPVSQLARTTDGAVPTYQEAYEAMTALKETYPEGTTWTNYTPYGSEGPLGDSYLFKGGKVYGASRGVGCAAFSFLLSDAAFGSLPARVVERGSFTFEDVKVGDILRVENGTHSVIVLQKSAGGVVIAEGNYNSTVHWGRVLNEAEVLAASFIVTRYPANYVPADDPEANTVEHEGTAGSLNWTLTKAGVLTISGNGAIPDYTADNSPWKDCNVNTIVIEKGVTGIGDYAFDQCGALSIYLPDGITKIGECAFRRSALLSVTIPGTVETIGNNAFQNCANLTSVSVSEGVKVIGDNAFRGCTTLGYIDFPASITSVGAGAFMSCDKMTRVRFMPGSGTVTMGDGLFAQCWELTSVTLPLTADCITENMFQSCLMLPELYIPASVKTIGQFSFTKCRSLKYIYFGGSEAEWNIMTTYSENLKQALINTTVIFNAEFNNPFAPDPNDPGDLLPDGDDSEKDPTTPDDGDHTTSQPPTNSSGSSGSGNSGSGSGSSGSGSSGSSSGSGSSGNSSDSSGSVDNSGTSNNASTLSTASNLNVPANIQRQTEPVTLAEQPAPSETDPDSENESEDTEHSSPQDQEEAEAAPEESPKSAETQVQPASDEEITSETDSESSKSGVGILVPAMAALAAAAALGAAFVFLKKKP